MRRLRAIVNTQVETPAPETAAAAPAESGPPRRVHGVARRDLQVGYESDQRSVVVAGLDAGDLVVTDGAQRLTDDARVALAGPDGVAPDAAPRPKPAGTAGRRPGGRPS